MIITVEVGLTAEEIQELHDRVHYLRKESWPYHPLYTFFKALEVELHKTIELLKKEGVIK